MKVKLLTSPVQTRHQRDIAIKLLSQCYQSKNLNFDKLLNIALVRKHQTVLECFDLTFLVEGISYASHVHFIRHRFTTPFVQSQRYTEPNVGYPVGVGAKVEGCIAAGENNYYRLIERHGFSKDKARYALSQGALINMGLKMNMREFMHVVKLRTARDAMKETQEIAKAMLEEVKKDEVLRRFFE